MRQPTPLDFSEVRILKEIVAGVPCPVAGERWELLTNAGSMEAWELWERVWGRRWVFFLAQSTQRAQRRNTRSE